MNSTLSYILIVIALFYPIYQLKAETPFNRLLAVSETTTGVSPPVCTPWDTCNDHGRCSINPAKLGECVCDNGYTTQDSNSQCGYKQKPQVGAFLLELFLGGFGAGYFYVGLIGLGVGQLILTVVGTCIIGSLAKTCENPILGALAGLCSVAGFGWWLYAVIMFGLNNISDSNGINLKSW